MDIRIKYINLVLAIVFGVGLIIFTPNQLEAAFTAGPGNGSMEVVCAYKCGSDSGKLQLVGFRGSVGVSVYSRPFNFSVSSGGNLTQGGSVPIGATLTFSPYGSASGSWWVSGGGYDTPDMGTGRHYIAAAQTKQDPNAGVPGISVSSPTTSNPSSIVGGGAVSCVGWTCTASGVGTAYITVTFSGSSVQAQSMPKYPNQDRKCRVNGNKYDCKEDTEYISYGAQSITIYFVVYQPNRPPVLNSCTLTPTGYTTAQASWTYTDSDGDNQSKYRISGLIPNFNVNWSTATITSPDNTATTNGNITGLVAGGTYNQVTIEVHDGKVWSQPFTCSTIRTTEYPEPSVTFNMSKFGDTSNAKSNSETLILKTGDSTNVNWSINNGTDVGLQSCSLSTSNVSLLDLLGETEFRSSLSGVGFIGNIYNKKVPTIPEDRVYAVKLNCIGKDRAYPNRSVNQTINLKVEAYPTVSCSIENNKRSVQEGDSNITIKATVGNVNSYTWKIGRGINDTNPINSNGATSNLNLTQNLSYVGLDFGRYSPWIEVTKSGGDNRTTGKKSCGTFTNFGSSTIREVNP